MAAPLETCTREEQRSVIRFLRSKGVKPIEIHRRMKVQYSYACLSQQQVYEWSRNFANGVTSVEDAPRPGQALFWSVTRLEGPLSPVHHTQISYKIIFGLQSNQSDVDCRHQASFCNMTIQGPTLSVQQSQQSQTCILSVFLIHHIHQTLPQEISICLDHSKKQWEERSSVLMKRYATRCMSGCADYQKNFILKEFMHFVSAGGLALRVGGDYVEK